MSPAPPPSPFPWFDVVIILFLVALNGVFAMSELAIVSAREARLKAMTEELKRSGTLDLAVLSVLLRELRGLA